VSGGRAGEHHGDHAAEDRLSHDAPAADTLSAADLIRARLSELRERAGELRREIMVDRYGVDIPVETEVQRDSRIIDDPRCWHRV